MAPLPIRQNPGRHPWPLLPSPHHQSPSPRHAAASPSFQYIQFSALLSPNSEWHLISWLDNGSSCIHGCPFILFFATSNRLKKNFWHTAPILKILKQLFYPFSIVTCSLGDGGEEEDLYLFQKLEVNSVIMNWYALAIGPKEILLRKRRVQQHANESKS